MKRFPLYIYIIGVLLAMVSSCDDYDSWTADPQAQLTFARDTVSFDTLISTVSSSTQRLLVYNNNESGVRISDVRLKHAGKSHFRVNVDGQFLHGGHGSDFEVRRNDSIFVLVEVTLPDTDTDSVAMHTDSLCFQLESGVQQYVTLIAGGQNALHWRGVRVIDKDSVLHSRRPVVIYDSIYVSSGTTLTIEAGTQLYFHQQASMCVDGTLVVNGTLENPVVFRGDRTGNLFDYLPYDNTPQQWGGVYLNGSGHKLTYLDLHSSTFGIKAEDTDIELANCVIHNTGGNALWTKNCRVKAYNTQISNAFGNLYQMIGGETDMTFCTLAQFYNFDANRGWALALSDYEVEYGDTMFYDVSRANFTNCIITGYGEDVILGSFLKESKFQDSVQYHFKRCFLNTVYSDGDSVRFVKNIYENPEDTMSYGRQFLLFDTYARIYDFTPDTLAHFCDSADVYCVEEFPLDRLGRSRQADGRADIGAYENVQRQTIGEAEKEEKKE